MEGEAEKCNLVVSLGEKENRFVELLINLCHFLLPIPPPISLLDPSISPPWLPPPVPMPDSLPCHPTDQPPPFPRSHTPRRTVWHSKFTSSLMWGLSSLARSRCTPITTWVRSHPRTWGPRVPRICELGAWGPRDDLASLGLSWESEPYGCGLGWRP